MTLDDEGLKTDANSHILNEVSAEEEARFRRWEEAQSKPRNERVKPKSVLKEEFDEELDDVKKIKRKNYQLNVIRAKISRMRKKTKSLKKSIWTLQEKSS